MRKLTRVLAAALLLPLTACTITVASESAFVTDDAIVDATTAVREEALTITEGMGEVTLALEVRATAGAASWTLTDPDGVVRFCCEVDAAQRLQQHCSFANQPGTWRVRREWRAFAGTQTFAVQAASGERTHVRVALGG